MGRKGYLNRLRKKKYLQRNDSYKIEGYWRKYKDESSEYQWPVANQLTQEKIHAYVTTLQALQHSPKVRGSTFKGYSYSRITGENVGNKEFYYRGWRWPEGLIHYIEHGVKPSDEFIDEILSNQQKEIKDV